MKFTEKNIYELLPAIYRIRDEEQDDQLKALLDIVAKQAIVVQKNIAQLYDNWFIETCEPWVVPYIGDLLGVRNFHAISGTPVSQRAYIANTLRYRRRKGIAPVLEQLTLDITGWRAHVIEFFQWLQTTQYMNHIRLQNAVTPNLRQMDQLDRINTPFDTVAHSADVRHISAGRGRYNIPNIGLFVWRLQSYPVIKSEAFKTFCIPSSPPSSPPLTNTIFTFSPLGIRTQLFNTPATETSITHISTAINVPGLLHRRALYDELEARRQALKTGTPIGYLYFNDVELIENTAGATRPVLEIFKDGDNKPLQPEEILICNLAHCCGVPANINFEVLNEQGILDTKTIQALVDPIEGRIIFTDAAVKSAVVSYNYGFSGDIGGGAYNRQSSIAEIFRKKQSTQENPTVTWQAGVSKSETGIGLFDTIQKALDVWNLLPPGHTGIITVMDSRTYEEALTVTIKEKSNLLIIAAGWPPAPVEDGAPGETERVNGNITADSLRPCIKGNIVVTGAVSNVGEAQSGGELTLNGLLIAGKTSIQKGNLGGFNLTHATLVPNNASIEVEAGLTSADANERLSISVSQSICGRVQLNNAMVVLRILDSIVDKDAGGASINATLAPVIVVKSTILGITACKTLEADSCIFVDVVKVERKQTGCVRFSYVAPASETPPKFRCQPDLEITTETEERSPLSEPDRKALTNEISGWLLPAFTSTDYGHYGYGQLAVNCPIQITTGADNGAEMGVFNFLQQPQRLANLQIALQEYLPLGLEAGIIYVT